MLRSRARQLPQGRKSCRAGLGSDGCCFRSCTTTATAQGHLGFALALAGVAPTERGIAGFSLSQKTFPSLHLRALATVGFLHAPNMCGTLSSGCSFEVSLSPSLSSLHVRMYVYPCILYIHEREWSRAILVSLPGEVLPDLSKIVMRC